MFSATIASAAFGITRGAIYAYSDDLATRVSTLGVVGNADPFQQEATPGSNVSATETASQPPIEFQTGTPNNAFH